MSKGLGEAKMKYRKRLKEAWPHLSDEQIEEMIERRVEFWRWMVENFDKFFDIK